MKDCKVVLNLRHLYMIVHFLEENERIFVERRLHNLSYLTKKVQFCVFSLRHKDTFFFLIADLPIYS